MNRPSSTLTHPRTVRDQARHAWSKATLSVESTDRDAASRALWRHLVENEGQPADEQLLAWRLLTDRSDGTPDDEQPLDAPDYLSEADAMIERALGEEIQGFANQFFKLAAVDRQRQWQVLSDRCAGFPRLLRWLQQLKPALNANPVQNAEGYSLELTLAKHCEQTLVAAPSQQGAVRSRALSELAGQPQNWVQAARMLRKRDVETANCDPALLSVLTTDEVRQERLVIARAMAKKRDKPVKRMLPDVSLRKAAQTTSSGSSGGWWYAIVIYMVVSGLIRIGMNDRSSPRHDPPQTNFNPQSKDSQWIINEINKSRFQNGLPPIIEFQSPKSQLPNPQLPNPSPQRPSQPKEIRQPRSPFPGAPPPLPPSGSGT